MIVRPEDVGIVLETEPSEEDTEQYGTVSLERYCSWVLISMIISSFFQMLSGARRKMFLSDIKCCPFLVCSIFLEIF